MNSNDNNPLTGGTGSSSIPSPVDFTNPSNVNTSTSSLSMSDSLASAQDNLTSAGQAANSPQSDVIGLNQIGADDPSASMITPDQPLTPAAPVPGSIGSVTSVPPLASSSSSSFTGMGASMGATPNSSTSVTTSSMPTFGGGSASTTSTSASSPASEPAKPYYNPFAAKSTSGATGSSAAGTTMSGMGQMSSATVPASLQPQTEKFSDRLNAVGAGKKHSNVAAIIGWGMAVVCAVAAVIFAVLWIGELNKEPEIRYVPVDVPVVEDTTELMSCSADFGDAPVEGLENLIGHTSIIETNFVNGQLKTVKKSEGYDFTDGDAATLAWESVIGPWGDAYSEAMSVSSDGMSSTSSGMSDAYVNYITEADAGRITADTAYLYQLPVGEDGSVAKDLDSVKAAYESAGFVCNVD